jgi:hypothetical protein
MRNYLFLISIVFFLCSCGGSKSPEDCKTAEGSQWSQLKKNCVKLADSKFTLKSQEAATNKTGTVYLIFGGSNSSKSEVLLPGNTSTGVLVRSDDIKPWMNAEWSLEIASGGKYALKKNGVLMYAE